MDITYPCELDCSSWAKVRKTATCAYCKDLFTKPCTLICCHTFCYSCIKSIKMCPTCKPNEFFSFKLLYFENHFIARLTKVVANQQKVNQLCTDCIQNTTICKKCYIIGCYKCNSQKLCVDKSRGHVCHPVDLNNSPEELLHLFSATEYCEQHETNKLTIYCYTCERMKCFECLQSCTKHKTSRFEDRSKSIPKLISSLDKVKEKIVNQESTFMQHKVKLDELFIEDFDKAAKWFEHAYNCLFHEKQNTVFRLKVFQCAVNERIERFKSDLALLTQSTNDFQTYFTLLFEKSSDDERHSYKENTLEITYRVSKLENAIKKIANQFENNLDHEKIFKKYFTLTHVCEGIAKCDTKCKKVDDLRSHLNTDQKYKLEVISYCQAHNDHDKLDTDQIVVHGNIYSMFSLPHVLSELVICAKRPIASITKCASCISQLKLYNKMVAMQDVKVELKDRGNEIYKKVIYSIRTLFDISKISITNIETAIKYLHKDNRSMYFNKIQKNFTELESFAGSIDDFQKLLETFSSELQSLQTAHMDQLANIIYSNMLLDITIDCQTYISSVQQIVINIQHSKTMIEKLSCNENGEHTDIYTEGFQIEMVSYYSTCVALHEVSSSLVELIHNWIK